MLVTIGESTVASSARSISAIAFFARLAPANHLGDHRIVERSDLRSGAHARLDAKALGLRLDAARPRHDVDVAGFGNEAFARILGVDARFDRVTARAYVRQVGQCFTERDANLQLDEIEARHHLGYYVLHLKARVDLEKVQFSIRIRDELAGSGAAIADAVDHPKRRREERAALGLARFSDEERGR